MITLNVSTEKDITSSELASFFAEKNTKCQITSTTSSVPNADGKYITERGFRILIFETNGNTFKREIWDFLQKEMNLKCAFVKYREEYMGCVLNWPDVFSKNNCKGKVSNITMLTTH